MVGLAIAFAMVATTGPVVAQESGALDRVERLSTMGKADQAREVLLSWWKSESSGASRSDLQRALWLRGRLTVDPAQAELDFRRLIVEFPGGPFTDRALYRLAQSAFASGDADAARKRVADLVRSYPGSRVARRAQDWIQEVGDPPPPLRATAADTASPAAARPAGSPASRPDEPADASQGSYAVQLGAFVGSSNAEVLAKRARDAGLDPRVVTLPGSRLVRVRVGRFGAEAAARDLMGHVKDLGFQGVLVRDADKEQPVSVRAPAASGGA